MSKCTPDADANERIGELLDQTVDFTARFLADRTELSASASFVINRVCREGPMRLTALAAKEGVSQPSMTQLIQRLERHDLVTRFSDPADGRAALIGITAHGREVIADRRRARRARLTEFMSTLSADEAHTLWLCAQVAHPVLQRLVANADLSMSGPVAPQTGEE